MLYPINATVQTDTGLIVTAIDKTAPKHAMVVAVGPDATNFKFGDRVVYSTSNLNGIKYGDEIFFVIPSSEILCKLSHDPHENE